MVAGRRIRPPAVGSWAPIPAFRHDPGHDRCRDLLVLRGGLGRWRLRCRGSRRRLAARAVTGGRPVATDRLRGARPTELPAARSEEHTSELQSLMRISYADF